VSTYTGRLNPEVPPFDPGAPRICLVPTAEPVYRTGKGPAPIPCRGPRAGISRPLPGRRFSVGRARKPIELGPNGRQETHRAGRFCPAVSSKNPLAGPPRQKTQNRTQHPILLTRESLRCNGWIPPSLVFLEQRRTPKRMDKSSPRIGPPDFLQAYWPRQGRPRGRSEHFCHRAHP